VLESPTLFAQDTFQKAWIVAARHIATCGWDCSNLVVRCADPTAFDGAMHQRHDDFAERLGLLPPKDVAYTVFPHNLYRLSGSAERLFVQYNRPGGMFDRLRKHPRRGWGTYFRRMTHYEAEGARQPVNQLQNILRALNSPAHAYRAAYTMVIQRPGAETVRHRGGPCLNYIAVQVQPGNPKTIGLLCVYRNHDFLERAYGNYWGLCNLLSFMATQARSDIGPLTCVSSHAYVDASRRQLQEFLDTLP